MPPIVRAPPPPPPRLNCAAPVRTVAQGNRALDRPWCCSSCSSTSLFCPPPFVSISRLVGTHELPPPTTPSHSIHTPCSLLVLWWVCLIPGTYLQVNVDNNCVGFYQSMYLGSFCTQTLIDNQFSYQVSGWVGEYQHEPFTRVPLVLFLPDLIYTACVDHVVVLAFLSVYTAGALAFCSIAVRFRRRARWGWRGDVYTWYIFCSRLFVVSMCQKRNVFFCCRYI